MNDRFIVAVSDGSTAKKQPHQQRSLDATRKAVRCRESAPPHNVIIIIIIANSNPGISIDVGRFGAHGASPVADSS